METFIEKGRYTRLTYHALEIRTSDTHVCEELYPRKVDPHFFVVHDLEDLITFSAWV